MPMKLARFFKKNESRKSENRPILNVRTTDIEEKSDANSYTSVSPSDQGDNNLGYSKGFDVDKNALMIKSLIFTSLYILVGVIAYSFVFEKWTIIDSIFFAVVTFTTIGYGDLNPSTDLSRAFTVFFAIGGIGFLGFALGILGDQISKKRREKIQKTRAQTQRTMMNMFTPKNGNAQDFNENNNHDNYSEMTAIDVIIDEIITHIFYIIALIIMAIGIGYIEGWTIITSMYFTTITATTTGYGDIEPRTQYLRLFCAIIFAPLSVCVMGSILEGISSGIMNIEVKKAESEFFRRELSTHDIKTMNTEQKGKVSRLEFLKYMLVVLKKVDGETLTDVMNLFDKLDENSRGYLKVQDISQMANNTVKNLSTPKPPPIHTYL